jgi:hypothetical protein
MARKPEAPPPPPPPAVEPAAAETAAAPPPPVAPAKPLIEPPARKAAAPVVSPRSAPDADVATAKLAMARQAQLGIAVGPIPGDVQGEVAGSDGQATVYRGNIAVGPILD